MEFQEREAHYRDGVPSKRSTLSYYLLSYYPNGVPIKRTLSVPHRKHITSPLRAQEVNAIAMCVLENLGKN
jgi:hypothetical protein